MCVWLVMDFGIVDQLLHAAYADLFVCIEEFMHECIACYEV